MDRKSQKIPTPFSVSQIRRFFRACEDTGNAKMAMICAIACRTGMRRHEVLTLRRSWIDWNLNRIVHPSTKNGKARTYYLDPSFLKILIKWDSLLGSTEYLFPSQSGDKLISDNGFYFEYSKHLRLAGLWDKDTRRKCSRTPHMFTFHTWRTTFCSLLVNSNVEIYTASKLMGHNDVKVTTRYYAYLGSKTEREALGKVFSNETTTKCNNPTVEKMACVQSQQIALPNPVQLLGVKLVNNEISIEEYKAKLEVLKTA